MPGRVLKILPPRFCALRPIFKNWVLTEASPKKRSNSMLFIQEAQRSWWGNGRVTREEEGRQRRGCYTFSNHRAQPEPHSSGNIWEVVYNSCLRNIPAKGGGDQATYTHYPAVIG